MFEHLSARTRQVVNRLVTGKAALEAGASVGPFEADEIRLLRLLASNLRDLVHKSGTDLAESVAELYDQAKGDEPPRPVEGAVPEVETLRWKIGTLRAHSFRGLAPAGHTWSHDFRAESHLLYGPNGCGKSSLLGAIAWCLTGRIFRDDCPPSTPAAVDAFSAEEKTKRIEAHPDALALLDADGNTVSTTNDYWVALQLLGTHEHDQSRELWIRRHSADGLGRSDDGETWSPIPSIGEVGVSELDAELHVVMPARVPYLHFGENPDLVRLFAQVIGLDDLEDIATVAGKAGQALRRRATAIEKKDLKDEDERIAVAVTEIEKAATEEVKAWDTYAPVVRSSRTLESVKQFGEELKKSTVVWKGQLAHDLGLDIPEEGTPEHQQFKAQLEDLSGRVLGAVDELNKPLPKMFSKTVWEAMPEGGEDTRLEETLAEFERIARQQIRERLKWAVREAEDAKARLMLQAAEYFPEGSNECPVCTQDLKQVPEIRNELESLRPFVEQPHLRKELADLARELIAKLDDIVPMGKRDDGKLTLRERLLKDWETLKESRFVGLLRTIGNRFNRSIENLADLVGVEPPADAEPLAGEYGERFPGSFDRLDDALREARAYGRLVASQLRHSSRIKESLERMLKSADEKHGDSLLAVLQRGSEANKQLKSLEETCRKARELRQAQKTRDKLATQVKNYRKIAAAADASKELGRLVRAETLRVFKAVDPRMQAYYTSLYKNEILEFDLLTPGHAANPDVKNQVNLYLRAGSKRVPAGPFSNAGRLRALALSFVFALLEQSKGTLDVVVLDDPAFSLDDDHKARFVDRLVGPTLETKQVILATHYERFYKDAEPVFLQGERLQLPPRRAARDGVSFEPADLLQRVRDSINKPDCSWREAGINLRRYAERTLATISGYCPEPFYVFNKIPDTVDAYARISDPQIATDDRDGIVAALKSLEFERVMHKLAHDEEVTKPDVEDGLAVLTDCDKAVRREIHRFKRLYAHRKLDRAIPPSVEVLSLHDVLPTSTLPITGRAAAARDGVGVTWIEHASFELSGYQVALVKTDVLAPIALAGQYVLLDPDDSPPRDEDLVIAEAENGDRFARRFWMSDQRVHLEGVNVTSPRKPEILAPGACKARRIVGVLFDGPGSRVSGAIGNEWAPAGRDPTTGLSGVVGIHVDGNCLEPIARDGQLVLARKLDDPESLSARDLACVDRDEEGPVIKRCFPGTPQWTLCSVNPTESEEPIHVPQAAIFHVYRLVGVLFELTYEVE